MVANLGLLQSYPHNNQLDGQVIGLYGGSFNPAHAGHLHISKEAIKRFKADQLWWLVSPQNPLKSKDQLAPFEQRYDSALTMAEGHPKIRISDFEQQYGLTYSIDTIRELQARFPKTHFFYMIGADNFALFHKWQGWQEIMHRIPIAIFPRPRYSMMARCGLAAQRMRHLMVSERVFKTRIRQGKIGWTFIECRQNPLSSTAIRDAGLFRW